MRWVKTVIITVIVLAIIPTIVSVINKLSEGDTKYVEYEIIITPDNIDEKVYELYSLVKLDENNDVTNFLYIEYNGEILNVIRFFYYYDEGYWNYLRIQYSRDGSTYGLTFHLDYESNSNYDGYTKIVLFDEIVVEPSVSPSEIILISLIPLIFVSGLLIYQYKELGLKIRKE